MKIESNSNNSGTCKIYRSHTEVGLSHLEAKHLQNISPLPSHTRTSALNLDSQGSDQSCSIPSEFPAASKSARKNLCCRPQERL